MSLEISSHPTEEHSQHQQTSDGRHVGLSVSKFGHSYNVFEFPFFFLQESFQPHQTPTPIQTHTWLTQSCSSAAHPEDFRQLQPNLCASYGQIKRLPRVFRPFTTNRWILLEMLHVHDIQCRTVTGALIRLGKLVGLQDIQKRCTSSCFLTGEGHSTADTWMMAEHGFQKG